MQLASYLPVTQRLLEDNGIKDKDFRNYQGVVAKNDTLMCMQSSLHLSYASYLLTAVLWDKLDLNCIFCKEAQLFKFIGKFRYLGLQKLPEDFLIENATRNVIFFFENKTREIAAEAYLISISEIVSRNCVQQVWTGALLIGNSYILDLILEKVLFVYSFHPVKMRMTYY